MTTNDHLTFAIISIYDQNFAMHLKSIILTLFEREM